MALSLQSPQAMASTVRRSVRTKVWDGPSCGAKQRQGHAFYPSLMQFR